MHSKERKTRPELIRLVWSAVKFQKPNQATASKVIKYLVANGDLTEEETEELLNNAVDDGLLTVTYGPQGLNRSSKKSVLTRTFKIPSDEEQNDEENEADFYCYECHTPKNLVKCLTCPRSFHLTCMQENKGNTVTPISPANNSVTRLEQTLDESSTDLQSLENEGEIEDRDESSVPDISDVILKQEIPNLKNEILDVKPVETKDVICIGQVRPPSRRRKHLPSSYKDDNDIFHSDQIEFDTDETLCTRCRLLKRTDLRNPPNMQAEEMNYLLRFIFDRIKTWISADTYSTLPFSTSVPLPSKQEFTLFKQKCFKISKSLDDIDAQLHDNKYISLTEFQCDIIDIKHCIGILYGMPSAEYEATKYLLSDCMYELSEIRQCPDCYRHSNEKSNKFWFCKPCVPRHELVFAKQIGYSYWPAKVIKVKDNQYDVRFFGTQHSRAVIDASFVKPIDTELKSLKVKKTISFNRAMEELGIHQELLQWPPGKFTYEAERTNPVEIPMHLSIGNNTKTANSGEISMPLGVGNNTKKKTEMIQDRSPKTVAATAANKRGKASKSSPTKPPILQENELTEQNSNGNKKNGTDMISGQDITNGGKRKRHQSLMNLMELPTSDESDEESTISDYIAGKRAKRRPSGQKKAANKAKGRRKTTNKQPDIFDIGTTDDWFTNSQEPFVLATQDSWALQMQQKSKPTTSAKKRPKKRKAVPNVIEKLRQELTALKCPQPAAKVSLDTLQKEIRKWQTKIRRMEDDHEREIAIVKKMQWCYYCDNEAIYHCCWNTAYCSTDCQQRHWQLDHKKVCRRKR